MKKVFWLILIIVVAFPMNMISAQEPNTKEDNACYEGGSMAGKCDTPWEWVCGWYLARWEANGGWSTKNNLFNDSCVSLLPSVPITSQEMLTICHPVSIPSGLLCISDNQTGTWDQSPLDGVPDGLYLYINPPTTCPLNFGGKTLISAAFTSFLLGFGFTTDEIANTGLGIHACIYS